MDAFPFQCSKFLEKDIEMEIAHSTIFANDREVRIIAYIFFITSAFYNQNGSWLLVTI